jgi:MOSC domain-containing protein YiiM
MNHRVASLVAADPTRIPLAGDQLFVDLDLSSENLPPGTRLAIGSAVIEISDEPHTGCRKFFDRFGKDAHLFVNAKANRGLNLRGVNAVVVQGGVVRLGDLVSKT